MNGDEPSVWKHLPSTPTYRPTLCELARSVLAIGGTSLQAGETSLGGADQKEVYIYSPSANSWMYVCDMPVPRSRATAAALSIGEIIVIGGVQSEHSF